MSAEPGISFGVDMVCTFRNAAVIYAPEFLEKLRRQGMTATVLGKSRTYADVNVWRKTSSRQDAWRAYLSILTVLKGSHGVLMWKSYTVSPYDAAKRPEIFEDCCTNYRETHSTTAAAEPAVPSLYAVSRAVEELYRTLKQAPNMQIIPGMVVSNIDVGNIVVADDVRFVVEIIGRVNSQLQRLVLNVRWSAADMLIVSPGADHARVEFGPFHTRSTSEIAKLVKRALSAYSKRLLPTQPDQVQAARKTVAELLDMFKTQKTIEGITFESRPRSPMRFRDDYTKNYSYTHFDKHLRIQTQHGMVYYAYEHKGNDEYHLCVNNVWDADPDHAVNYGRESGVSVHDLDTVESGLRALIKQYRAKSHGKGAAHAT